MLDVDQDRMRAVAQTAFDKVSGNRRWEMAIARALRMIEDNPFMQWSGESLLILSPSGGIYDASRICQCAAYVHRLPCWHRAAVRLMKRYGEELDAMQQENHIKLASTQVTGPCDRCQQKFEGSRTEDATAGFYDVTPTDSPAGWDKFANPGERIVCDRCMWTDQRYVAAHGTANALSIIEADTAAAEAR